jgi:hypothetical protein
MEDKAVPNATAAAARTQFRFSRWLRTGFWLVEQVNDPRLEVKFNPNHDPENGRFTFADGGGAAGMARTPKGPHKASTPNVEGAGASGRWGLPGQQASEEKEDAVVDAEAALERERAAGDPSASATITVTKNGYSFQVDTLDRTTNVDGELTLQNGARSRAAQSQAGGSDRLPSDDGGHFIAARFNGPDNSFNHFAQDSSFNRGAYRSLEDDWAADLKAGKSVSVDIAAHYTGTSARPESLIVTWTMNGRTTRQQFRNARKGK